MRLAKRRTPLWSVMIFTANSYSSVCTVLRIFSVIYFCDLGLPQASYFNDLYLPPTNWRKEGEICEELLDSRHTLGI